MQRPLLVRDPPKVTKQEIEDHESTGHATYRSWCSACLAAKAHGQGHQQSPEEPESAVPTISSDYGFLGEEGKCLPILCLRDRCTKRIGATYVENKGVNAYAQKYFANFLESSGYPKIIN